MSWSDLYLAQEKVHRLMGNEREADCYAQLAQEHDEWLVSNKDADPTARKEAAGRLAVATRRVYRNGPIPTRDVAGEWDRRDEEGHDEPA